MRGPGRYEIKSMLNQRCFTIGERRKAATKTSSSPDPGLYSPSYKLVTMRSQNAFFSSVPQATALVEEPPEEDTEKPKQVSP